MKEIKRESARKLARLLFSLGEQDRMKAVSCLDTEFQYLVLEEISRLKRDLPLDKQDTAPPCEIPNCS